MKAYTDYPMLVQNGTIENNDIVPVEVLSYDRNKYCWVKWKDELHEIKSGYLFLDPQLAGKSWKWLYSLPSEIDGKHPTKHQFVAELKSLRKKKTEYDVYDHSNGFGRNTTFSDLKSAMTRVRNLTRCNLVRCRRYKVEVLLEKDGDQDLQIMVFTHKADRSVVKRKHLSKYKLIRSGNCV